VLNAVLRYPEAYPAVSSKVRGDLRATTTIHTIHTSYTHTHTHTHCIYIYVCACICVCVCVCNIYMYIFRFAGDLRALPHQG
jgi:hypothetical protein